LWFWYVVAVILGFDILVCLILAIPVDVALDIDVHGKPAFNAKVTWLFGAVTLRPGGARAAAKEKKPSEHQRPERKTGVVGFWDVLEILQTKGIMNEVKKLISRLVHCFHIKELVGAFRAGTPDPAYTGMLYGLFMAVTMPFGWPLMRDVRVTPVFDAAVFEGDLHAVITVRPISLVRPPFLFIFSGPVLRVIKIMVVSRWRQRKSGRSERSPSAA
jgi:hypothetical protein